MSSARPILREITEIVKSTLLALAISLVFLWCRSLDISADKLSLSVSELTVVLLCSIVALHGVIFAVISRVSLQSDKRREEPGHTVTSFAEKMKMMNAYLIAGFLLLFLLCMSETFISRVGIDIMGLLLLLVISQAVFEIAFFFPLIGTMLILRALPGRWGLIAGAVYIVLCVAAFYIIAASLLCDTLFFQLRRVMEFAAVLGVTLALVKLWNRRGVKKIADEAQKA